MVSYLNAVVESLVFRRPKIFLKSTEQKQLPYTVKS